MPFIPIWMYGNVSLAASSGQPAACDSAQSTVCLPAPQVLGAEDNSRSGTAQNTDFGLSNYNIFPIDPAMASGLMPVNKSNMPDPHLWAGSSVAIDVDSGTILYYVNGRKETQIASLTKMMTATLAIENIKDLNAEVTISKVGLAVDGTVVGCPTSVYCNGNRMFPGEKVKVIDLMRAMLMNSANDAATSLGIYMAGSPDKFVDMMNAKAKSLGLVDTHFCTPSGLEIDGQEDQCYSSAYDIARIAAYSMRYDTIWNIMQTADGQFFSTDGKRMHVLQNTDLLLNTLPNCIGGKTGFTPLAGKSLLLGATDDTGKHKIISVLLNDDKRWEDMRTLVGWIDQNYKWQ